MTPEQAAMAADELARARRGGKAIAAISDACRPLTAEDGYQVQRAFIAAWSDPVAGWKAGATLKPVQDRFGLTEPFFGPIFRSTLVQSPATLESRTLNLGPADASGKRAVSVEVEFAFRLGRDLAPRAAGYSESEVLDAVAALIPAIEIITPRFEAVPGGTPGQALADCGLNGGIVLGAPVTDWRDIDYPAFETKLVVDGKTVVEGTGALVLGHPFKSLVWLVNGLGRHGHTVAKDQVLTTGSMTGIYAVEQGMQAVGDFGALGQVSAHFV
ncbi:MAG: 2-keto-4-pentenoate hydratase [Hyphomicrobiaceae bacterium]